jgi:hypothetical protein
MRTISDPKSVTNGRNLGIKTVMPQVLNTHCIVCGVEFPRKRSGKLYCSSRCKQFGYNP